MINNHIAFVFPGQGSQSVGMLADLAGKYKEVETTFAEASQVLGYDLWAMVLNGPASELDKTMHTQPALLAASYAVWQIIQSRNSMKPSRLAGHSLGEYTALVCANALRFADAIKLVAARGQYMQDAVPPGVGAMAAIIGLDEKEVAAICEHVSSDTKQVLAPANFNSVGQVVIAGHKTAVDAAIVRAKELGAKMAVLIPVSVPSHCELMRPAAMRLAELLANIEINTPNIPIINNVDVTPYSTAEQIRDGLVRQLYMPVRWVDTIQSFMQSGVTCVVECGPGKVLTGLNKRIDKRLQLITTHDVANLEGLLEMESERGAT